MSRILPMLAVAYYCSPTLQWTGSRFISTSIANHPDYLASLAEAQKKEELERQQRAPSQKKKHKQQKPFIDTRPKKVSPVIALFVNRAKKL